MVELNRAQYAMLQLLLEPFMDQLVLPTILWGHAPAKCWTDDSESPSIAVAWDMVNTFVFCAVGTPSSEAVEQLGDLLLTELLPGAKAAGHELFHLRFAHEALQEGVQQRLKDHDLSPKLLHSYSRPRGNGPGSPLALGSLSNDFNLVRLTAEVLSSDLGNMDEIRYCVDACWRDRRKYLDEGIGYCIVDSMNVASWCSTDYIIGGSADLYVESFAGYRERGLATRVVSACVDACHSAGWSIHWHCWSDNRGSVRLAEKHGFTLASASPILRVRNLDECRRS